MYVYIYIHAFLQFSVYPRRIWTRITDLKFSFSLTYT